MLKVQNLSHDPSYTSSVSLKRLSFAVGEGEKIAILGLHGSGKSLLLQILAGYIIPQVGTITIRDYDLRYDAQEARRFFGFVPSHPTINGEWKVEETFQLFAAMREMPFPESTTKTLAEKWYLEPFLNHSISELHFGQKMRVLMALATLHDPDLILLDDPFQGLDPKEMHSTIDVLGREFSRSSIVLATNKVECLPTWIDRVMVLQNGVIAIDQPFSGLAPLLATLSELWKETRGHDQKSLETVST